MALAAAIAILLYAKCGDEDEAPPPPEPVAAATATASETAALPDFSPPPPPEEEDAGAPQPSAPPPGDKRPTAAGGGKCSGCGNGIATSALTSAVSQTANLARGCYNRALRTGGAEGTLMVSVSVGPDGGLCNASIAQDTLHNPGVAACVLSKFRSRSYPPPQEGCVVVNVPINFQTRQ